MGDIPYQEQVVGLVSGKVEEVNGILETALADMNTFLEQLNTYMQYHVTLSNLEFTVPNINLSLIQRPTPPDAPTINTDIPLEYPASIELTDIDIDVPAVPDIDPTPPNIPERELPEIDLPVFSGQVPAISTDIPIPVRPVYSMPEVPTIVKPVIPPFEGFMIPQLEGEPPEFLLNEIGVEYNYLEGTYSSDLAPKLAAWFDDVLTNGGTGLSPEVEQAIFDAAVLRLDEEFVQAYDKEMKFFASRGFRLPPGALRGALAEVHRLYSRKKQELSKEIMVKQAELAQANTHFAIQHAVQYEGILREFFNQTANRLMENAKNAVVLGVEVYNAKIASFNAQVEAYKTKLAAYEAQIRAVSLIAEGYKVQIEAAKVVSEIQALDVEIYKGQLEAVQVISTLYESDIKAAALLMESEKTKVELFKGQVEAYAARVAAESARINLYNALAENDKARASTYAEKMRGYGVLVDALKSRTDILIAKANLDNEVQNRMLMEVYKTNIAKMDSLARNKVDIEKLKLDKYRTDQTGYEAEIRGFSAETDAIIKEYTAKMQYAASQIELILKEAELNQNATLHANTSKLETLKGMVQVMAQLVSSAMSAINASMQLGYHGGYNVSQAFQGNTHVSETHSYQEYCDPTCTG